MATLSEDDLYRASTQYRLWTFTPPALASLRSTTNQLAADGVRAAIASKREKENGKEADVDCLTVEEEQKLVGYYCVKAMQLADFCDFASSVKATAVQYMKRFYLSNSPMTYHPKAIIYTALFLSTKTENNYVSLRSFASKLDKTAPDDVIAPEFLLTQGLRFAFDVRHPTRGLEGGFIELMAMAKGGSGELVKKEMIAVAATKTVRCTKTQQELVERIGRGHGETKKTLNTSAILTDVYFQFTPSQTWMAAWLLADEPLIMFYLDHKLSSNEDLRSKLLKTVLKCRQMLESSPSADPGSQELEELKRIDKKLYKCRNPEKMDLVGLNKAQKRDGANEDEMDEKSVKKRKLEREKAAKESDNIFGPALGSKQQC